MSLKSISNLECLFNDKDSLWYYEKVQENQKSWRLNEAKRNSRTQLPNSWRKLLIGIGIETPERNLITKCGAKIHSRIFSVIWRFAFRNKKWSYFCVFLWKLIVISRLCLKTNRTFAFRNLIKSSLISPHSLLQKHSQKKPKQTINHSPKKLSSTKKTKNQSKTAK